MASASLPSAPLANGFLSGCTGEYFNNIAFSGAPALVRTDAAINFFWHEWTSPGPGVNVNNYSVRWTCSVYVASAGNYTFNILTDDGMNVLMDGNPVIWAWYDQGPTAYSAAIPISAGWHTVRVEYYNRTLGGTAQVSANIAGTTFPDWKGEYFNNQTLSGVPTITRNDANINFNWGTGSPDPSIPAEHFSVRWTRILYLNAGTWRFTTTTDDGVRLWVDGTLLIDRWTDQPATAYWADIALAAGNHPVTMEYYDNTISAVAQLTYAPVTPPPPSGVWHGQYFNNISLSGAPVFVRDDPVLNFNWGETVLPGPGVPHNYFSAKWDSVQNFPYTGSYPITATSDDGVRVWVDGMLVIDGWSDHPPITYSTTVNLAAGAHNFHVEYYNRTLGAMIRVQIAGITPPVLVGDVIVDDRGPGWQAGGGLAWGEAPIGIGNHTYWAYSSAYSAYGYNWGRWYPTLPTPGYYEVSAYIPVGIATTLNARYWIYHGGRYDLAARAQGLFAEQWVSLGTYYFSAQGGEFVSLATVTYECYPCRTVAFDAIKFSPR
jgi:hypothetical protein